MGDPKKPRKKFTRPKSPWRSDQLAQELYLLGVYGLRNKRELWKASTRLSSVRKQARILLAATQEVRLREEKKLMTSLIRRGLVMEGATLDDVLSLTVEDVLGRRLQSMVFKNGLAVSASHARQLVVHGHVVIGERLVRIPGYHVNKDDEQRIKLVGGPPQQQGEAPPSQAVAEVEAKPSG